MATNRDLLKEAIADAKAVKETAIANAKAALEEAFTPYLKEKLSAKLNEMDEEMYREADETVDELMIDDDMMDEEVSLDELLAELDSTNEEENLYEAEKDEEKDEDEEMAIEDMDEDDLKSFIEDVIKDMVSAGELEAGHEGMENEEGAEEIGDEKMKMDDEEEIDINELLAEVDEAYAKKATTGGSLASTKGKDEYITDETESDDTPYSKGKATKISFMDEELDELTAAQSGAGVSGDNAAIKAIADFVDNAVKKGKKVFNAEELKKALAGLGAAAGSATSTGTKESLELSETVKTLKSELNEINLLNAKLLYTNKIFRNKSLTESQKVRVLTAFDKAKNRQEAQLVYETLIESLKVSTTKAPIKESMGSASKALGGATSKPIIENDAFSRMRELAFGNKK